jgi:hypothetical protein
MTGLRSGSHSLRARGDAIEATGVQPDGGHAATMNTQTMSAPGRAALGAGRPAHPSCVATDHRQIETQASSVGSGWGRIARPP